MAHVLETIDGIHAGTLRPPASDDAERRWAHEQAIAIFGDALALMPECAEAFEQWDRACAAPPPRPVDPRLARLELDRMEHNLAIWDILSRTPVGRRHLAEEDGSRAQAAMKTPPVPENKRRP